MYERFSNITLNDSILIKGWAIFLIVFHNYFHLIYKVTKENEMDFDPERFKSLITMTLPHPTEWIQGAFTYFGHFGVQLFIFLSAYGMARAYAHISHSKFKFFWSRVKKIYPTILLAVILWLAIVTFSRIVLHYFSMLELYRTDVSHAVYIFNNLYDAAKVTLGIHNFFPGHAYPKVGPWWFIPFIIQFYFLWALAGSRLVTLTKGSMLAVGLGGVAFNYIVTPTVMNLADINLLFTPLGHIPEIMLGVYWARYGFCLRIHQVIGALVVLLLSSLFELAWPLHQISALVMLLWVSSWILSLGSGVLSRTLYILGVYSLPLFLVNGFLRFPFVFLSRTFNSWHVDLFAGIAFFFFALGVAVVLARAEERFIRKSHH